MSVGNWCIVLPGENNVFLKLWLLGAPATQYLPPLLFGLLAIFCVVFATKTMSQSKSRGTLAGEF